MRENSQVHRLNRLLECPFSGQSRQLATTDNVRQVSSANFLSQFSQPFPSDSQPAETVRHAQPVQLDPAQPPYRSSQPAEVNQPSPIHSIKPDQSSQLCQ